MEKEIPESGTEGTAETEYIAESPLKEKKHQRLRNFLYYCFLFMVSTCSGATGIICMELLLRERSFTLENIEQELFRAVFVGSAFGLMPLLHLHREKKK